MTSWTMFYGPHPIQQGINFARVQELSEQWEEAIAGGRTWFTFQTLVPGTLQSAEVRLRAVRDTPVAFLPDSPH